MRSEISKLSLSPMSRQEAAKMIRRYLGSFPSLNLHDPEVYVADLCTLLCNYPMWAGEQAIQKVKETIKFPTTHAEIKPLLDDYVRLPKYQQEWDKNARLQIADTEALAIEGPAVKRMSYEDLRAKYDGPNGEPWGLSNPDQQKQKSTKQIRDELIARIGQEAFDAIPDAKPRKDTLGTAAAKVASHVKQEAAE